MIERDVEQAVLKVEQAKQAVKQAQSNTNLKNVQTAHQQILQAKQELLHSETNTSQENAQYLTAEQQINDASEQMEPARQAILSNEMQDPPKFRTESLY